MNEATVHGWLVLGVFATAAVTFIVLLFVAAPYGRHARPGWGPTLPYRLGWVLMESPAVLVFLAVYTRGELRAGPVSLLFLALWQLHYVYRTFIYPFRVRSSGRRTPVAVVALGLGFNVVNAYLNARWISHLGPYADASVADAALWAGVFVFLAGWSLNQRADHLLIRLRNANGDGYTIPRGGPFRWITCPNYLGEIVEWLGWALATGSVAGLAFAAFTAANLIPRAIAHHRWYRQRFPEYPADRRALIPYLL